jgi:predicted amidohydrolase
VKNLKAALLQLMPEDTLEGNLQKGSVYCRKSKEMGADVALFPEMWSIGYNIPKDIDELKASAV